MIKKILMIFLVVIGVIILIWFLFFRHLTLAPSQTATSTTVTLKIPILKNDYPGQISATSTNVASTTTAPTTVTQAPAQTVTNTIPPKPKTVQTEEWKWFKNLGISFKVPKTSMDNLNGQQVTFTQNNSTPYGYLYVLDSQNSNLSDLAQTISKSPDVINVQKITVAGFPAVEYTGSSWQKNGLVILANNKFYYLYGALLKHSIRDTIYFY